MTNRSALPRVIKKIHQEYAPPPGAFEAGDERRKLIPSAQVLVHARQGEPAQLKPPARVVRGNRARIASSPYVPGSAVPSRSGAVPLRTDPVAEAREAPPREIVLDDLPPGLVARLQETWSTAWQQEQEEAVVRARTEAADEVRAELQQEMDALQAELDTLRAAYREDAERLQQAWQTFIHQTEPLLLDLAFGITRTLFEAPLPEDVRSIGARALTTAIDQLAADPPITISLHPVDLLRLQESGIVDQLEAVHSGLRWDARSDFNQGDWIAQSPEGAVRRVKEELMAALREQLEAR
jgi:hypothetical protein